LEWNREEIYNPAKTNGTAIPTTQMLRGSRRLDVIEPSNPAVASGVKFADAGEGSCETRAERDGASLIPGQSAL
jgi:hypothetical protein